MIYLIILILFLGKVPFREYQTLFHETEHLALYESESIFSIGFTASLAISSATSTVGQPNFNALYIFLSVFIFMYSHSLQLQPTPPSLTSGGTG